MGLIKHHCGTCSFLTTHWELWQYMWLSSFPNVRVAGSVWKCPYSDCLSVWTSRLFLKFSTRNSTTCYPHFCSMVWLVPWDEFLAVLECLFERAHIFLYFSRLPPSIVQTFTQQHDSDSQADLGHYETF